MSVLRLAADLVDQGWCQSEFQDEHGRRCLLGAIDDSAMMIAQGEGWTGKRLWAARTGAEAVCGQALERGVKKTLTARLRDLRRRMTDGAQRDYVYWALAEWNDRQGRTAKHVAGLLRRAAAGADPDTSTFVSEPDPVSADEASQTREPVLCGTS